jgi:putative transposase
VSFKSNQNVVYSCKYHCPKYRRKSCCGRSMALDCDLQFGIDRLVRSLKRRTSRILRQECPFLKSRRPGLRTNSYFCASVGGARHCVIKQCIEHQKGV